MSHTLRREIRDLINEVFNEEELTDLCYFHFSAVYEEFQSHDRKQTRLRRLLEYVERRGLTETLLAAAIEEAPARKAEFDALRRQAGRAAPGSAATPPLDPIINHRAAVERFDHLLQPQTPAPVLWLTGQAKMGKSHLLKKIFPARAAQQQHLWAGVELRGQASIFDTLHRLRMLLSPELTFPTFDQAYQTLQRQAFLEGQQSRSLEAFLSRQSRSGAETPRHDLHLTRHFVADLLAGQQHPLILLFDTLDELTAPVSAWLLHAFLVQVAPLAHIRVVLAGRTPPPADAYNFLYHSHPLTPVTDPAEYARYCHHRGLALSAEEIADYIQLTDHTPGLFVELVNNFHAGEADYVQ